MNVLTTKSMKSSLACAIGLLIAGGASQAVLAAADTPLPDGVRPVWDLRRAYSEETPTRQRICINGLWRWQPAEKADRVPTGRWGYFKVPGCWPGASDYMQHDCQTVFSHPSWKHVKLGDVTAAWYQREISVPKTWAGRRITLCLEYLNSSAEVFIDGKKAGEAHFPAGDVDLTELCPAGGTYTLSLRVVARPLAEVMLMFNDTNSAHGGAARVQRRGLCGDLWLVAAPATTRIGDVQIDTSVRKGRITFRAALENLAAGKHYTLRAVIGDHGQKVRELVSRPFGVGDLREGRFELGEDWKPERLWDLNTPQNTYEAEVSLLEGDKQLDAALPLRFGFREFWIDGRDFYLNGTRIFLSALPLDNAAVSALTASYAGAKETLRRLKGVGINFVYTHNYGCEPGTNLSFAEILRAADDVGMLVSLSQPHFAQYDWKTLNAPSPVGHAGSEAAAAGRRRAEQDQAVRAGEKNGYARHARFFVGVAGNHPSVVFYSMSHNATGYNEDMNPDLIDGIHSPRNQWSANNVRGALAAEAIVARLDPGRIVYHHSSGNLSSMHDMNFYTNMAPSQELDDWFEHWAVKGVKPLFTCEYMVPCTWDWTMYRGWYKGVRTFGEALVPWEYCIAEWSAQVLGDRAYRISEAEKTNLRWEAQQFRNGRLWHRWDYPYSVGSQVFDIQHEIIGAYLAANWRAFRTWGVSAISPWEFNFFWRLRPGVDKGRKELKVDWDALQRPGYSADYIDGQYERMDLAYQPSDWEATADGQAILRNNGPLLAYIAGKPAAFTGKDHNFQPGETVEKQLVIINNSRETVTADYRWALGKIAPRGDAGEARIATGQQERIPIRFDLPSDLAPGKYKLSATVKFSNGEQQDDNLAIDVMPKPATGPLAGKIALFDPKGETAALLLAMGIKADKVEAGADLSAYDILILGKAALTADGPGPNLARVGDGLKVLVFEQTPQALEKRLGFRIAEYGLRQAFPRVPDHPALAGLATGNLRDWRGSATLQPPRLDYDACSSFGGPGVRWCGIEVPRVWRCGNRGNVASVLIEKPAKGDFLPILDGGYALQYSPLLEYREGKGMVLFCQVDVTGRTEQDPAAETLVGNLVKYVAAWKPSPRRAAIYVGGSAGRRYLDFAGIAVGLYNGGEIAAEKVLIVGSGGQRKLPEDAAVAAFLKAGGRMLCLGLNEEEARDLLPFRVGMTEAEHIAACFEPPPAGSLLSGVSPADVYNRDPRKMPLVSAGATVLGDGVLAQAENSNVVFYQFPPYAVTGGDATAPSDKHFNLRRTYRRAAFALTRLLANMGVSAATPLLGRFSLPVGGKTVASVVGNGDFRQAGQPGAAADRWQFSSDSHQAACTRQSLGAGGGFALRLDAGGAAGKSQGAMLAQQDVPVQSGQWYRISLKAKAEGMDGKTVAVALANTRTWRSLIDGLYFTPTEEWQTFKFLVQSNGTAEKNTRFQIWHTNAGTLWLADIRMMPTPPPTEGRWLQGLYLDQPVRWDDPYRFFRW